MKPNSITLKHLVVLCGLLISFASFAINSQNESEDQQISIDRHMHQPTLHNSIQSTQQIPGKTIQDNTSSIKQPPLNIVASFIFIEAKTNQDHDKEVEKTSTGYEKIIHNLIQVFF